MTWTREDPVGAGPVAALAAGLAHVRAEHVLLLAADLPFLTADVPALLLASVGATGAVLVDDVGKEQYLCSAWPTDLLRCADLSVDRLSRVITPLCPQRVRVAVRPGSPAPWTDCDTPYELEAARRVA